MLLSAHRLCKSFTLGEETLSVIEDMSLSVDRGEFVAIMGTSGSGKSTLMHIFGGLSQPDSGSYFLNGSNMLTLDDRGQSWARANWIGFIFQTFHLLPELNVVGNVSLPFLYKTLDRETREKRIDDAIARVGLTHRKKHKPAELSGGEMQRVAIARALVVDPLLILADEPTGNLDAKNSFEILNIFSELNKAGSTIIMVTHDSQVAAVAQRTLQMKDGALTEE